MTDNPTPDSTADTKAPEAPQVPGSESELPQWARDAISRANSEAAAARIEKGNALANAKTLIEAEYADRINQAATSYSELEVKFAEKSNRVAKLEAILNAGIPSDRALQFAELVQGSTEEEITASVGTIKDLFSQDPQRPPLVDHTQGQGSNPLPLNGDGLLNAVKRAVGAS